MTRTRRQINQILGAIALALIALHAPPSWSQQPRPSRVAVMTFESRADYESYAELGEELAMFFTAEIAGMANVELVERGADSVLWDEFSLNRLTGDADALPGTNTWVNADIIVRGRFGRLIDRQLNIEIINATNADILASHTFEDVASYRSIESAQTQFRTEFGARASELLLEGVARKKAMLGDVRVAPLFFKNASKNRRLDHLEQMINDLFLDEVDKFHGVSPLRFGGRDEALDEQALALIGFSETRPDQWQRIADCFVWGSYEELPTDKATNLDELEVIFKLNWLSRDGREGTLVTDRIRFGAFEAGIRSSFATLKKSLFDSLQPTATAGDAELRTLARKVSDQLIDRAVPLNPKALKIGLQPDEKFENENLSYAMELTQAACLLDPSDIKKQFLRLALRFEQAKRTESTSGRSILASCTVCERYLLDNLDWIERFAAAPASTDKAGLPPSAFLRILENSANLNAWRKARFDRPDLYVQAAERGLQKLQTTPIAFTGIDIPSLDRFGIDGSDNPSSSLPLDDEQQARLLAAFWQALPEEKLNRFISGSFGSLLKLERTLGHPRMVEILSLPEPSGDKSPFEVNESHFLAPFRPGPAGQQPAADLLIAVPKSKTLYYHPASAIDRPIVGDPKPLRLSLRQLQQKILLRRELLPRNAARPDQPVKSQTSRFGPSKRAVWSSDGSWCIDHASGRPDAKNGLRTEMIFLKWTPKTREKRDISPPDADLLSSSLDAKALIGDRWLYLIGVGENVLRFNLLDLHADGLPWQSFECALPKSTLGKNLGITLRGRSEAEVTSSGQWLLIRTATSTAMLRHGETKLRSADPLFRPILNSETEARRQDFAGEVEIRESLSPAVTAIASGKADPQHLESALQKVRLDVQKIVGSDDDFYILHKHGLARVATDVPSTRGPLFWHTRLFPVSLKIDDNAPTWTRPTRTLWVALTDGYCLVAERRARTTYLNLIDRSDGRFIGAVAVGNFEPEEFNVVEDECFLINRKHDNDRSMIRLEPVFGYLVPELAQRLATPEQFPPQTTSIYRRGPKPKFTKASPQLLVDSAIASHDTVTLDELLEDPANRKQAFRYEAFSAAVTLGNPAIVRALLEHGANVNHSRSSVAPAWPVQTGNTWSSAGRYARAPSPLVLAAQRNDRAMVDLLLDNGAYAQLKDLRFRTAIDFASDERLKQHMTERCERQIRLEEMLPVAANYIGYPFHSSRTPEAFTQALSDALNAEPELAYISMESGHSLLHALVAIEAKRAPKGKDGSYDLSDTLFPLVPDLDFNAPDARGRNILTQELAPADREELDTKFAELALQLGCNPHLKDDRGFSALDYIEKQLNTAPKSISESMNKRSKLSRIREKFRQIPMPVSQ